MRAFINKFLKPLYSEELYKEQVFELCGGKVMHKSLLHIDGVQGRFGCNANTTTMNGKFHQIVDGRIVTTLEPHEWAITIGTKLVPGTAFVNRRLHVSRS